MFVPLNKSCVMVGGAVPPLRKNPQDDIALSSTEGKGANQIVGVHSPAPTNKTLNDNKSKSLVFHGGELLDKIKFGSGKAEKRENIKFLF